MDERRLKQWWSASYEQDIPGQKKGGRSQAILSYDAVEATVVASVCAEQDENLVSIVYLGTYKEYCKQVDSRDGSAMVVSAIDIEAELGIELIDS